MESAADRPLHPVSWVKNRQGVIEAFDADRINRSLFAATRRMNRSDALLARELTDGVLHFLDRECDSSTTSADQLSESIEKLVRELGHPLLARAYAQRPEILTAPDERPQLDERLTEIGAIVETRASVKQIESLSARKILSQYSLERVFSSDVKTAHNDGLIALGGLGSPTAIGTMVYPHVRVEPDRFLSGMRSMIDEAGEFLILDGIEHCLQNESRIKDFVSELDQARCARIMNLNTAEKPNWAIEPDLGPLFPSLKSPITSNAALEWLNVACSSNDSRTNGIVAWHISEVDFAPEQSSRLATLCKLIASGAPIFFFFDRSKGGIRLGNGLKRGMPGTLIHVGLNMHRLALQVSPDRPTDYLNRIQSLARIALSAAMRKREFLAKHGTPELRRGFTLARSVLTVFPANLMAAVRHFFEWDNSADGNSLDFARQILARLHACLRMDGASCMIETSVDCPYVNEFAPGKPANIPKVSSLGACGGLRPIKNQIRAAGTLHAAANGGVLLLECPESKSWNESQLVEILAYTWKRSSVLGLQFSNELSHSTETADLFSVPHNPKP